MEVLRTPEDCFDGLPDYDFAPHYREVTAEDGTALRYHFIDEGPRDADPILLLHGNPSWCYLYRAMIPGLVARGHRVVALDLMGMGRSDKPVDPDVYSLAGHVGWMEQWLVAEDLNRVTLFCQDWGGTAGLNLLPVQGDRFARVIASNTGLPTGQGATKMIADWLAYSQSVDVLPIGFLLQSATTRELTAEEQQAYMAPFPDGTYQASPKRFPLLIPLQEDNPGVPQAKATWEYLTTWEKPFLTVFSDKDTISFAARAHVPMQERIPGAHGQPHVVLEGPGHFLQEDAPNELVEIIDAFIQANPA